MKTLAKHSSWIFLAAVAGCVPPSPPNRQLENPAPLSNHKIRPTGAPIMADTEEDLIPDPWDRSWNRLYMLRSLALSLVRQTGTAPATLQALLTLSGFDFSKDAWGTSISYSGGPTFQIRSAGPDRAFGTQDDIVAGNESITPPRETP